MLKANLLLLLAAAIWGFGFVAQRLGMEHLEPYAFNGIRFAIGALSLLPLVWWYSKRQLLKGQDIKTLCQAGLPVGVLLFIGASLQQVGLLYTTASKAGFITGLYLGLLTIGVCFCSCLAGFYTRQRPRGVVILHERTLTP